MPPAPSELALEGRRSRDLERLRTAHPTPRPWPALAEAAGQDPRTSSRCATTSQPIEEITERQVIASLSANHLDPDIAIESFPRATDTHDTPTTPATELRPTTQSGRPHAHGPLRERGRPRE